ncbi:MAG: hypothetical protein Q8T11_14595 [Elusimicrobiota bacterium]|nr:hypothetical protein [Elusimicrobiota bacterium]
MRTQTLLLALGLFGSLVLPAHSAEHLDVSLIQLIANPKAYDGKLVRVTGYVRLEFEGNGVFLHSEDYKYRITKNGLWIDAPENIRKSPKTFKKEFNRKFVLIEGTFSATMKGHKDAWSGSIQKITGFYDQDEKKDED